jgi:MFS family permease
MSTWFSATAVLVPLAAAFGIPDAERGWITSAVQFGFVSGAVASAITAFADRLDSRTLIRIGIIVAALSNAAITIVHEPAFLFALRFLTGAGLALVYPPALRLLTAAFPQRRGIVTGIAVGALAIGSFSPHLFAAELPWRTAILVASALALCGIALISAVALPSTISRAARFDIGALRTVLANGDVMLANAGYWGHMWELYAVWAWGPAFLAASLQASNTHAPSGALVFMFFGIIGAAGCIVAGVLADRFGRPIVAGAAMAISGTLSLVIGLAFGANPYLMGALFAIWGFSVVADSAQFSSAVTELADQQYVGTALTFQMGVGFLITMFTIWLVGAIEPAVGWRTVFMLLAAGPLIGVAAMAALQRRLTSKSTGSI